MRKEYIFVLNYVCSILWSRRYVIERVWRNLIGVIRQFLGAPTSYAKGHLAPSRFWKLGSSRGRSSDKVRSSNVHPDYRQTLCNGVMVLWCIKLHEDFAKCSPFLVQKNIVMSEFVALIRMLWIRSNIIIIYLRRSSCPRRPMLIHRSNSSFAVFLGGKWEGSRDMSQSVQRILSSMNACEQGAQLK